MVAPAKHLVATLAAAVLSCCCVCARVQLARAAVAAAAPAAGGEDFVFRTQTNFQVLATLMISIMHCRPVITDDSALSTCHH